MVLVVDMVQSSLSQQLWSEVGADPTLVSPQMFGFLYSEYLTAFACPIPSSPRE